MCIYTYLGPMKFRVLVIFFFLQVVGTRLSAQETDTLSFVHAKINQNTMKGTIMTINLIPDGSFRIIEMNMNGFQGTLGSKENGSWEHVDAKTIILNVEDEQGIVVEMQKIIYSKKKGQLIRIINGKEKKLRLERAD